MDTKKQGKWYFRAWPLVVSFLCVGPLMLPLVWKNPRFSKKSKIVISIIIIILTSVAMSGIQGRLSVFLCGLALKFL